MPYIVRARYYAADDQFGESYVLTSDNWDEDTRFEVGASVYLNEYPMKKDPFEWMRRWLESYAKENEINVKAVMDWIESRPTTGG